MNIDRIAKVSRKYVEFITTKCKVLVNQKTFFSDNTRLKYMLKTNDNSKELVVVFSSCTRKGLKARYNYVRTLNNLECNKLFILDDFAADHRGSYYLGKHFKFNEEAATQKLIDSVYKKLKCESIALCGSSKGGYAALNFGLQIPNSKIVIGAPQYFLADYLANGNEDALNHIIGSEDIENRHKILNEHLRERVKGNPDKSQEIHIHYSNQEHTYFEHIQYLMEDLHENHYKVIEEVESYENHSDISYYFPDFLIKHLSKMA